MMELLETALNSPWVYLAILAIATLDGFFPVVPSETMVITAGVFAASGRPNLALVIGVAAVGAFIGDNISYQIGKTVGPRLLRGKKFQWAARTLKNRGGVLLIAARYIPGGRTAATLTTGIVGYPRARFVCFDAVAALTWAVYSASAGYLGGQAFEDDKFKGVMVGLGIAIGVSIVIEVSRFVLARKKRDSGAEQGRNLDDLEGDGEKVRPATNAVRP